MLDLLGIFGFLREPCKNGTLHDDRKTFYKNYFTFTFKKTE